MSKAKISANEAVSNTQLDASQIPNLGDLEMGLGSVVGDVSFLKVEIDGLKGQVSEKASAEALAMLKARLDEITARLALLEARP